MSSIAELRTAGRTPRLPLCVEFSAGGTLLLEKQLRLVPGKRLVAQGRWNDQTVLVKLFFAGAHQRHGERERAGVVALQAAGVATPALLTAGAVQGGAYAVVSEFLPQAQTLAALADDDTTQKMAALSAIMPLLARMHAAGLAQADLHLGNFLQAQGQIYAIDGDAIIQHGGQALPRAQILTNLAVLFAGLTPDWDAQHAALLALYRAAPAAASLHLDEAFAADLPAAVHKTRARRLEKFLEKTGRDCTQFAVGRGERQAWAAVRPRLAEFAPFFADPDRFVDAAHCFKTGGTCTVVASEIAGQTRLIKRYNLKNWRHALSRAWRPSRAWHSWRAAHLLDFYGIATPSPLAVLEERRGPLRGRAFLVTELCPGKNLLDTLNPAEIPPPQLATALLKTFTALYALRISHGDCKGTNLFWHAGKIYLIDLDALTQHRSTWRFKRAWRRDRARFLRNWPADSPLVRWLDAQLPGGI
ncbi:lipopolysaccharide kinase InaA family protein [Azonexus sp.]|uniref:lipopolysaccharide kinase InaA family protein n=1 Tax=Azonexus sp. TaxID=1872668 RepID=UPI0039E70934